MVVLLPALAGWDPFRILDADVTAGNRAFAGGDYQTAVGAYARALADDEHAPAVRFNLGTTLAKQAMTLVPGPEQDRLFAEAERLLRVAARTGDSELAARAHYNLGNALLLAGRVDDAIVAYIDALQANPAHEDARHNLELALRARDGRPPRLPPESGPPGPGGPPGSDPGGGPDAGATEPHNTGSGDAGPGEQAAVPPGADAPPAPHSPPEAPAWPVPTPSDAPGEPGTMLRFDRRGDDDRKMDALEERSREVRNRKLRSTVGSSPGARSGKDW
jgi:hypothetical protein